MALKAAFKDISFFFFFRSIPLDDRERVSRERPCNCLYDRCAMEKRGPRVRTVGSLPRKWDTDACVSAIYRATSVNTVARCCLLVSPVVLSAGKLSFAAAHPPPSLPPSPAQEPPEPEYRFP